MKAILSEGHNCWVQRDAQEAGVLVDGQDYYRSFYEAAQKAERSIAMTGWQFDSDVSLLRGQDLEKAQGPVRLLEMLEALCEQKPELHVYILAWDFSLLLALEREWMQTLLFKTTSERIHFRFDASSPLAAAHHQKLVLIDGSIAFTGGMDICDCRWDERSHPPRSTLRCDSGRDPHGPYHDVQTVVRGPVVEPLVELFEARWFMSGGGTLSLPRANRDDVKLSYTLPLAPGPVALSRTFGKTLVPAQPTVQEVRELYVEAIQAAERFIYIENQYFSSRAIFQALVRRLRDNTLPKVEVIFVLPKQPEALREQLAMGVAQVKLLRALKRVVDEEGHALGVYCSALPDESGADRTTYIHSKVMVVDDAFVTIGSANTTNRSLGLDSELNLSWEGAAQAKHIRRLRVSLLSEHSGCSSVALLRAAAKGQGLVRVLDALAEAGQHRLRFHALESVFDQNPLFKPLEPKDLIIDPEDSILDESLFESFHRDRHGLFASGMRLLTEWLVGEVNGPPPAANLPVLSEDRESAPIP